MMRKIYHNLAKITLLVLLATSFYFPGNIQTVHATEELKSDICAFINAQSGSVGDEKMVYEQPKPNETKEQKAARLEKFNLAYQVAQTKRQAEINNSLDRDSIFVITEEPLGSPTGDLTTNCARKTTCSSGYFEPNNPKKVRKCFTTYVEPSQCANTAPPDAKALKDTEQKLEYCEIVQIYSSSGGTSLLYGYIGIIYKYMAGLGSFIAVLMLIMAGVMRSAAGDKPDLMTKANQLAMRCITGLIVLFLSAVILYTINPNFFVLS